MFIILFNLAAGHTRNIGSGTNYFATFISTISPVRYGTEMLMYRIVRGSVGEKYILTQLGFTMGDTYCIAALVTMAILCFLVGWYNLLRTNRAD